MWRRWGKPQNIFLAFIDELEKQIIIKNTNFTIYNVAFFFLKKMKNTCRYHHQNLNYIYDQQILRYRAKQTEISNFRSFLPFIPLKTPKIKILKNEEISRRYHILHMCTKIQNHMMYSSWDTHWDRQKLLLFWAIFCPFTSPLLTPNIKILKKWQKYLENQIQNQNHTFFTNTMFTLLTCIISNVIIVIKFTCQP